MESETVNVSADDIQQLKRDIALIKDHLLEETELTDWAKEELSKARATPREEYVSMKEIEEEFLEDGI